MARTHRRSRTQRIKDSWNNFNAARKNVATQPFRKRFSFWGKFALGVFGLLVLVAAAILLIAHAAPAAPLFVIPFVTTTLLSLELASWALPTAFGIMVGLSLALSYFSFKQWNKQVTTLACTQGAEYGPVPTQDPDTAVQKGTGATVVRSNPFNQANQQKPLQFRVNQILSQRDLSPETLKAFQQLSDHSIAEATKEGLWNTLPQDSQRNFLDALSEVTKQLETSGTLNPLRWVIQAADTTVPVWKDVAPYLKETGAVFNQSVRDLLGRTTESSTTATTTSFVGGSGLFDSYPRAQIGAHTFGKAATNEAEEKTADHREGPSPVQWG